MLIRRTSLQSAQLAYDNASNPRDELPDDAEPEQNECPICGIEIKLGERHRCPQDGDE